MFHKNKLIQTAYQEFLLELDQNKNKLISLSLSDKAIKGLEDSKYNITKFEIYLYLKARDYLWTNGIYNINLSEGITLNQNKFRNILVDLYYQNIPNEAIFELPISALFKFELIDNQPHTIDINKLSEWDLLLLNINYVKNNYDSYFGNYNTYYTFKQLIKLYLENTYFYFYKGKVYTESQLDNVYDKTHQAYSEYGPNWFILTKLDNNLVKLRYKCLNVKDPKDISVDCLSDLQLDLIVQNDDKIFDSVYIVHFKLSDFWLNNNKV